LKRVGLLSKRKKIISLAANETLFFLKQGKFSAFTMKLYRDWYNHTIDGLICIGDFQQKLACEIIEKNLPIRRISNGLPEAFFKTAKHFSYNPEGKDLVLIANGPSSFRVYYKGLDLAIKAFCLYCINGASEGRFLIIGDWLQSTQNELLKTLPNHVAERVVFKGRQASFIPYLQNVGLCIHFSRGDSFPTSNLETLALGIPTMITNTTGTVEIVQVINKEWVVPMEVDEMALRIKAHFKLPGYERIRLSRKAKDYMIAYNHNEAIIKFKAAFMEMVNAS
jgi:glycosyltransferase involved in cell wall biosynthesis